MAAASISRDVFRTEAHFMLKAIKKNRIVCYASPKGVTGGDPGRAREDERTPDSSIPKWDAPNTEGKERMNDTGKRKEGKRGTEWSRMVAPRVKKEAKIEGRPVVDHQARDPEYYTGIPIARQHPNDWTSTPKVQPTSQRLDKLPKV